MSTTPQVTITPEVLASEFSLVTAVTRLDFLSRRDNVVIDKPVDTVEDDDDWMSLRNVDTSLDAEEALELLALGEVVARKAHSGWHLGIWAALRAGVDHNTRSLNVDVHERARVAAFVQHIVHEPGVTTHPDASSSVTPG